jgi:hypothetical protein
MVAYALLSAGVIVGLLLSGRAPSKRWPRFAIEDVHRFLGLLTGVFIALHAFGLLIDSYLPFSLADLIVPGAAPYRSLATAAGVVAAELLAALAVTNHYRIDSRRVRRDRLGHCLGNRPLRTLSRSGRRPDLLACGSIPSGPTHAGERPSPRVAPNPEDRAGVGVVVRTAVEAAEHP